MILSAQSIRRKCIWDKMIDPFVERCVHHAGMSYGLSSCGYDIRLMNRVIIKPSRFILGSSLERFDIPVDIAMRVMDKSSWARRGIFLQTTIAEPGWRGYLTLEISNNSDEIIDIAAGEPICQVIFELLDEPTDIPYTGKYQNQGPYAYSWIKEKADQK